MKKLIIYCVPLLLLIATSCYKTVREMGNSSNQVILAFPVAAQFNGASSGLNFWDNALITPDLGKAEDTLEFSLNIPHALNKAVTITLGVDKNAVTSYNKDTIYGGPYALLPDSTYSLVTTNVVLPAGILDTTLKIALKPSEIDISQTGYILPVSIISADGIQISPMKTAYIHIKKDPHPPYSRANWAVLGFDSQEDVGEGPDNGRVYNLYDNKTNTYWHSEWKNAQPPLPHWFSINMNTTHVLHGIEFLDRQGVGSPGRPKDVTIQVSKDGTNWTTADQVTLADQNGSWQKITFQTPTDQVQYFKVTISSTYGNTYYTNMAELKVF